MEFIKEPGVEIVKKWKRVKEENIAIAVYEEYISGKKHRIFELIDKFKDKNKHIEAYGIIARIIWKVPGCSTIRIFADYFHSCKQGYRAEHYLDPDAWRRDLEQEFCKGHIDKEESLIKSSLGIYKYLSDSDAALLKGYVKEYLEFAKSRIIDDNICRDDTESLDGYFDDVLRLQYEDLTIDKIKRYEDKSIIGNSCYVDREIVRLRSYLIDKDREDRSIVLEYITEKLLHAYFAIRSRIDGRDPHDINRSLMLLYDNILLMVIMVGWELKIKYSDEFVAEWKIKGGESTIVSNLLGTDKPYPHSSLSKDIKVKKNNITFHSTWSEAHLTAIFNGLKANKYLDGDSSLSVWLYICGRDTGRVGIINWVKHKQSLAYLVYVLFGDSDGGNLWVTTKNTFTVNGKEPNTNSMKGTISKIKCDYKNRPKDFVELDRILRL